MILKIHTVVVGAGHMFGDTGIITQLEKKVYIK